MHRWILEGAALICLLAVMTAAGGCVALYTLSKAGERPAETDGGVGVPLVPPGTTVPTLSVVPITTVTALLPAGDGQPFIPQETVPSPIPTGTATSTEAPMPSSNATPSGTPTLLPTADGEPPGDGPPPHDEIPLPTLPATPL
jgi:hypothetical protein